MRDGDRRDGETVREDGSLQITNLSIHQTGCYACKKVDDDSIIAKWYLFVRGENVWRPLSLSELTSMIFNTGLTRLGSKDST